MSVRVAPARLIAATSASLLPGDKVDEVLVMDGASDKDIVAPTHGLRDAYRMRSDKTPNMLSFRDPAA